MGCDIHAHIEVKLDGKWEHYSCLDMPRDYRLFGKMAGVRNRDVTPIAEPRFLPGDLTKVTLHHAQKWKGVGHSHSWLTHDEMAEVEKWYEGIVGFTHPAQPFGYLFGNGWDSGKYEARVVFWFDN